MTVIWDADQSLSVRVVRERMDYLAADCEDPAYTTVMSVMVGASTPSSPWCGAANDG